MDRRWADLSERRDPARALLLCLLVLFQLFAAAPFARASNGALVGCFGLTTDDAGGKKSDQTGAHDHQQCAHCKPHQSALTPPSVEHRPAETFAFVEPASLEVAQHQGGVLHTLPPQTGPPQA